MSETPISAPPSGKLFKNKAETSQHYETGVCSMSVFLTHILDLNNLMFVTELKEKHWRPLPFGTFIDEQVPVYS